MRHLFIIFLILSICLGINVMNAIVPSLETMPLEEFHLSINEIDSIANDALEKFNVPGTSISLVFNDQILLSRGYGFRDLDKKLHVTEYTLFPIASCTKAFTALLLGQSVPKRFSVPAASKPRG